MKISEPKHEVLSRTLPSKKVVQPSIDILLRACLKKDTFAAPSLPGQTALPAFRSNGGTGPTVQRVVDVHGCVASQNRHYLIPQAAPTVLYGAPQALAPVPARLYTQGVEQTNDAVPVPLRSWTPNVRFFSQQEQGDIEAHPQLEIRRGGLFGCFGGKKRVPDHRLERALIEQIDQRIQQPGNPATGIIGKNDCGEFATYLQHLIGESLDRPAAPGNRQADETYVGDKMFHKLNDPNDCPYHYATIVAADGESKVTLEANAGVDLTAPQFDIVNGIAGFMEKNNVDYDNGETHIITGLEAKTPVEHQQEVAKSTLDRDTLGGIDIQTRGAGPGNGNRKITKTVAGIF